MEITGGVRSWVEWPIKGEGDGMGRRTSVGGREGWEEGITHISHLCMGPVEFQAFPFGPYTGIQ